MTEATDTFIAGDSKSASVWRKSTRSGSGGNECVEVAIGADRVRVRDSKSPDGDQLEVSRSVWAAFIDDVKRGRFDRA